MANILVVDDEQHILELIRFTLEKDGHSVICLDNGINVCTTALMFMPVVVVLDLMLPGMDGFEVCKQLQRQKELVNTAIIMLTARDSELDKVVGLELGADDYMTKPFSPRELSTRIKVLLRRKERHSSLEEQLVIGDLVIKPSQFQVVARGNLVNMTLKEFELLQMLGNNPGKVFTRDYLLDSIWGITYSNDTRTVDVHIRHLRQKLDDDASNPKYIETIRGIGYRLRIPK